MKFIGITGGVGAGKSAVLDYLATKPGVRVMLADEIAHELMEPGTDCYEQIRQAFPEHDIYKEDGHFDRIKLAKVIFSDENKRAGMNGIVHPAVKAYVIAEAKRERQEGTLGKTDGIPWVFQREGTADFFESVEGSRVPETLQCCDRQQ